MSGEGYLKNVQKALNKRPQHLCNNTANLLTRLVPCCHRILGTRPRMTGAGDADLVPVNRLLRFARNDGRVKCGVVGLLLCVLFPKVSFFLPNPVKTC